MITPFPSYAVMLRDGLTVTPANNTLRSEFESGHVRQERINTLERVEVSLSYKLCGALDYQNFRQWVRENGFDYFLWNNPDTQATTRARIVGGSPRYELLTRDLSHWKVTLTIEYVS